MTCRWFSRLRYRRDAGMISDIATTTIKARWPRRYQPGTVEACVKAWEEAGRPSAHACVDVIAKAIAMNEVE